jgi:phage tail-like protein
MAGEYGVASVFTATFDGISKPLLLSEISGLKFEVDVIEVKSNTKEGVYEIHKLPGKPKPGEITLTRAMRKDEDDFATWFKLGFLGDLGSAGKGGSIVVMDPTNEVTVRQYDIAGAFPKKLEFGQMKAGDTSVVTEKLTLVHSGISSPATKLGLT